MCKLCEICNWIVKMLLLLNCSKLSLVHLDNGQTRQIMKAKQVESHLPQDRRPCVDTRCYELECVVCECESVVASGTHGGKTDVLHILKPLTKLVFKLCELAHLLQQITWARLVSPVLPGVCLWLQFIQNHCLNGCN